MLLKFKSPRLCLNFSREVMQENFYQNISKMKTHFHTNRWCLLVQPQFLVFGVQGPLPQNNERFERRLLETNWTALKDKERFGTQFLYNAAQPQPLD